MMNTTFFKKLTVVLVAVFFASCDKDYNTLGSDLVGNENFLFDKYEGPLTVNAYNQRVDAIQTNNLAINQLGVYSDPVFGKIRANFVTQLSLDTPKPEFGENVVVDSVVLTIPYFSTKIKTESDGDGIYELDSIYSNAVQTTADSDIAYEKIDLKVYENGYYLRDYDPNDNFQSTQKYYSDQDTDFDGNKIGPVLNDYSVEQSTEFVPSAKEHIKYKVISEKAITGPDYYTMQHYEDRSTVDKRTSPRIHLRLKKSFFETKIMQASSANLDNNNTFQNYFRGLYFQVQNASEGSLMSLDFKKGDVTIYYTEDLIEYKTVDGVRTAIGNKRPMKTLKLNMKGNTVNLLENTDKPSYSAAVSNPSTNDTDHPKLYAKGGRGSQVFVELFASPNELEDLRVLAKREGYLINQANLIFTIDQNAMRPNGDDLKTLYEPQRVFLFDADNNTPLADYSFDNTTNSTNNKLNKTLHGGIIKKVSGKGTEYKINITQHVNSLIKNDSTNVRLGLVVTESINLLGNSYLKTPILAPKKFDRVPLGSAMNPIGTVLYGSNPLVVPADKRIKFEIYYTKPN